VTKAQENSISKRLVPLIGSERKPVLGAKAVREADQNQSIDVSV
jgi:hypothetical protein